MLDFLRNISQRFTSTTQPKEEKRKEKSVTTSFTMNMEIPKIRLASPKPMLRVFIKSAIEEKEEKAWYAFFFRKTGGGDCEDQVKFPLCYQRTLYFNLSNPPRIQ